MKGSRSCHKVLAEAQTTKTNGLRLYSSGFVSWDCTAMQAVYCLRFHSKYNVLHTFKSNAESSSSCLQMELNHLPKKFDITNYCIIMNSFI